MAEFEVGGHKYRSGKIPALRQLHVARRLAPVLGALKDTILSLKERRGLDAKPDAGADAAAALAMLGPIADVIARMSDDDATYIIGTCLGVCSRNQSGAWTAVWSDAAGGPMFDDIDMITMLHITVEVVKDSLGPFFAGLTSG